MWTLLRPAATLLILSSLVTGLAYPAVLTFAATALFPRQAHGSLIENNGALVGSHLIGQPFAGPTYFWSRPSATSPNPYNALGSTGSNLGPLNPALVDAVKARVSALNEAAPLPPVPADLVTSSASGLDPDISVAAAQFQAARVAQARHLGLGDVQALIAAHRTGPEWGFLGEARVNVLELNLALDALPRAP